MTRADKWRRKLFSLPFDHPDPIHKPPTKEELAWIFIWENFSKKQRFSLVNLVLHAPYRKLPDISIFNEISDKNIDFLEKALCYTIAN